MRQTDPILSVDIRAKTSTRGPVPQEPNHQSFDVALIDFKDDGTCVKTADLDAATDCIRQARTKNPNGAVVVLFIHGWHHSADWDDTHYVAFRQILTRLALREAERYPDGQPGGRRVVGIYLGWNGDPEKSRLLRLGWLKHLSFWNRYSVACAVGEGDDIREAVRRIISTAKGPIAGEVAAPLILVGHSMGALVLESVFLSMLQDAESALVYPAAQEPPSCVQVRRGDTRICFPDLMLSLNSAADSEILKATRERLHAMGITKSVVAPGIGYSPPLFISVTSTADLDTGRTWRVARFGGRAGAHDPSLITHDFASTRQQVDCQPRGEVDFGQSWHGLRAPTPVYARTPSFYVDLPVRERSGPSDRNPGHERHSLIPRGDVQEALPVWVFQLPREVVADHNDIFGYRSNTLLLALMQISGAVLSLANDWSDSFE